MRGFKLRHSMFRGSLLFLTVLLLVPAVSFADLGDIEDRVVEVIVTYQKHDSFLPWQKSPPAVRSGYGILVGNSRVVTTESLVRNHRLVELRKARSGEKITASVETSDSQVNLALLRIEDERKSDQIAPVQVAEHVPVKSQLEIVQFDETSQIQHSKARILRISMSKLPKAPYQSLSFSLLSDVSVNGEGAAVVYNGKLAGMIMNYDSSERTAAMLPYSVLDHFLSDTVELPYKGFASAGFIWTPLVDPAKRTYLNVHQQGRGILVLSCLPDTGAFEVLKPNDVILEWDGHVIDNLGFYEDREFGRLGLSYLIKGRREPGDVVPVRIVRDGAESAVDVKLVHRLDSASLIPENVEGRQPEYLVSGGFIIREVTGKYLRAHGSDWKRSIDSRLAHLYLTRKHTAKSPGEHVVILSGVLPDPINIGYHDFRNAIITSLNGETIKSMADVFRVVDRDGTVKRLALQSIGVELVLDPKELATANSRLARLYRIPQLRHQRQDAGR